MHDLDRNEDRLRGTYDFPFEFHHIESNHPRYVMSYHWHVEYEIIRILKGSLTVTLNEKSFIAMPGDIIFVHSGILHSGIPDDCVYQCIVFDANGEAKDENGNAVMKQWWDITEEDQKAIMANTEWCMADNGYFRGGGYSSRYETKAQMPATMIRLNLVKGLGPVLQIAEGWTVALPAEVSDKLWKRTDYTWPCTWFAPRCDGKEGPFKTAYDVMNNWGANHGAISYGHIGADLITMCSMLRIPVSMHNVPEKDIYRPAAWNAFGMDKEGADFRACKNYGPLYK